MWLAEWLWHIIVIITANLSADASSAREIMVLFIQCYTFILMPNLFLMNTAHNKDRIIDDGLLSTIKNGLVLPLGLNSCFCLPSPWQICENRQVQTSNITDVQSTTNKHNLEMSTRKLKNHNAAAGTGIYTISKSVSALSPSEKLDHFSTSDACENPSTSNGFIKSEKRCPMVPFVLE